MKRGGPFLLTSFRFPRFLKMISFLFFLPFVLSQSSAPPSACGTPFSWVNITTQDQLIQLSRSNCTFLSGSVALQGPGITDLSPLKNVSGIQRSLDISSTGLTTFSGLESLETLGESLFIRSNPILTNLFGINRLNQVEGGIQISGNPKLVSIAGLGGLKVRALSRKTDMIDHQCKSVRIRH